MKQILVAVDFSQHSESAILIACKIALFTASKIKIIHVMPKPYYPEVAGGLLKLEDEYLGFEKEMVAKLTDHLTGFIAPFINENIEYSIVVEVDDNPFEGIIKEIKKGDSELVVIGGKGKSDLKEIMLGSVADKIIRYSYVPVLTVKNLHANYNITNILFASDFKDDFINEVIEKAKSFAKSLGATLKYVMINNEIKEFELSNFASSIQQKFNIPTLNIYNHVDIEKGIQEFAGQNGSNLIILCTHGRTGLAKFFKSSVAEELIKSSPISILSYNINPKIVI